MASTTVSQTPAAPSRLESFLGALALLRESPIGMLGALILLFWVTMAILAPILPLHDPNQAIAPFQKIWATSPKGDFFPLGTDHKGRDILSRLIWGSQRVLIWSTLATTVAYVVGMLMGVAAGYLGGLTEYLLMRLTDVFLSIPPLVLAMSIMGLLEPTLTNGMIAVTVMWWPWYTRLVYNIARSEKEEGYVLAAEVIGASKLHIMFREILPNCIPSIITKMTLDFGFVILIASSLSFLGLGVQPPTPDLGSMVAEGAKYLPDSWWLTIFPGLAILVAVFGFNLIGDALREILGVDQ